MRPIKDESNADEIVYVDATNQTHQNNNNFPRKWMPTDFTGEQNIYKAKSFKLNSKVLPLWAHPHPPTIIMSLHTQRCCVYERDREKIFEFSWINRIIWLAGIFDDSIQVVVMIIISPRKWISQCKWQRICRYFKRFV